VTIRQRFGLLGLLIFLGFGVAGGIAKSTVDALRPEGEALRAVSDDKDLIADGLPPPLNVVESLAEASLALRTEGEDRGAHLRSITRLKGEFEQSFARWSAHPRLRSGSLTRVGSTAREFFSAVDREFVPPLTRGDRAEGDRVFAERLSPLYNAQHEAIVALMTEAQRHARADLGTMSQLSDSRPRVMMLAFAGLPGLQARAAHLEEFGQAHHRDEVPAHEEELRLAAAGEVRIAPRAQGLGHGEARYDVGLCAAAHQHPVNDREGQREHQPKPRAVPRR
jgi:hypothetical protein